MPKYLLLARDTGDWSSLAAEASPEEIQAIVGRYIAWSENLARSGNLVTSEKLKDGEGRVVRGSGEGMRVTDGPHAESKEVIGGFWLLRADDYDHALRLVSDCPHLDHGTLELREVEDVG